MARIPIAQVPNAPQVAAPVMTPTGAPRVNLLSAAEQLNQDTMALDSFSGEARGWEALGEAGQRVAAVADDFAMRMSRASDTIAQSKAEAALAKKYGEFQIEMQNTPFDQWGGILEKKMPDWKKEIDAIPMSGNARAQVEAYYNQYSGRIAVDVGTKANLARIEDGRMTMMSNADRRLQSGDYEGYAGIWQNMVDTGMASKGEQSAAVLKGEMFIRENAMNQMRNQNPLAFQEEMKAAMKNGKSEDFPWMTAEQIRQQYEGVTGDINSTKSEATYKLRTEIAAGNIPDKKTLEETANSYNVFNESEIKSFLNGMESDPPEDYEKMMSIMWDIKNTDFSNDNFEALGAISNRISNQVPKKMQQRLLDELNTRWGKRDQPSGGNTAQEDLIKTYAGKFRDFALQGMFTGGDAGYSKKRGESSKVVDPAKNMEASRIAVQKTQQLEQWVKDNPGATLEQIEQTAIRLINPELSKAATQAIGGEAQKIRNQRNQRIPINQQKPPRGPLPAEQIMKKLDPASIRYNNPGAMYFGPSARKFGSSAKSIIGGGHEIAVFDTPMQGAAAQFDLLDRGYTGKTLRQAITRWSGGNSVDSYLAGIKKETGIDENTVLTAEFLRDPSKAIPLVKAMARHEAGKDFPLTDAQWKEAHKLAFN